MAARVNQPEIAETLEEADAQLLTVPKFEGWYDSAHTLSGYNLFGKLGRADSIGSLRNEHLRYRTTGRFEGTLLELRLLFIEARTQRHGACLGYHPNDDPKFRRMMTALLGAVRALEPK